MRKPFTVDAFLLCTDSIIQPAALINQYREFFVSLLFFTSSFSHVSAFFDIQITTSKGCLKEILSNTRPKIFSHANETEAFYLLLSSICRFTMTTDWGLSGCCLQVHIAYVYVSIPESRSASVITKILPTYQRQFPTTFMRSYREREKEVVDFGKHKLEKRYGLNYLSSS